MEPSGRNARDLDWFIVRKSVIIYPWIGAARPLLPGTSTLALPSILYFIVDHSVHSAELLMCYYRNWAALTYCSSF